MQAENPFRSKKVYSHRGSQFHQKSIIAKCRTVRCVRRICIQREGGGVGGSLSLRATSANTMPNNGFNVTRKWRQGGNYDDTGNILSNWTRGDIVSTAVTSAQISQVNACCSLHLPGFVHACRIRSFFSLITQNWRRDIFSWKKMSFEAVWTRSVVELDEHDCHETKYRSSGIVQARWALPPP